MGIADRIIAHEPYFIELGHNMPSAQPIEILQEAQTVMYKAMQALGNPYWRSQGRYKDHSPRYSK